MNDASADHAAHQTHERQRARTGVVFGLCAYGLWGVLPVYFKLVASVSPFDIVAHRIVWSMVLLGLGVALFGRLDVVRQAFADRRSLRLLVVTATLIAGNWLLYVYAINSGHILAGSLGYYLNPLANILLGRFLLSERLTRLQWAAVALAAAGVAVLAAGALDTLWISLTLCFSFAFYGFFRKGIAVDSVTGLTVETILLFPFALVWLLVGLSTGREAFGNSPGQFMLLASAGLLSTAPLLLFTEAARRLPYSTVGMLQFVAPTLQFLLAVLVYDEPFTHTHLTEFAAIWTALVLYVGSSLHRARRSRPLPE
jgi:chloramphenicol-sensitive protein RarD